MAKSQADLVSTEKHDSTFLPLNENDPKVKQSFLCEANGKWG